MKILLQSASKVIHNNIILLLVLNVFSIVFYLDNYPAVFYVQILVQFLCVPLIYARFYSLSVGRDQETYIQLFQDHWKNYTVVYLLLACPRILLYKVFLLIGGTHLLEFVDYIITVLSVFIFPFVFLRRAIKIAFVQGIDFIKTDMSFNLVPMFLVSFSFFFPLVMKTLIQRNFLYESFSMLILLSFMMSIISSYFYLLALVLIILKNRPNDLPEPGNT
ncbi:MAG: hypothetical protein K8S27_15695 [Candidatus Omnitrophica bacterium]|nr:hypothetical protein [Candidatus Omnitrophota bacterium]